jgi:hypothetical protein
MDLDDDAEDVLARLRVFHTEVTDLVSFDEILPIVLDSEALFGFYGYAVALGKNIDVSAAGRLPERRGISHADHLDEIRSRMPHVHAELQVGIVLRARKVRKGRLWWISRS